jgi:hypothetical protein
LAELHSERFVDCSPAQVWATLLDEGRYLASERTPAAAPTSATDRRVDQQAHDRRGCSQNSTDECLIRLDRRRPAQMSV